MTIISNQPRGEEFQKIFVLKSDCLHRLLIKYYGAFQLRFKKTILVSVVKYELFENLSRLRNKKRPVLLRKRINKKAGVKLKSSIWHRQILC